MLDLDVCNVLPSIDDLLDGNISQFQEKIEKFLILMGLLDIKNSQIGLFPSHIAWNLKVKKKNEEKDKIIQNEKNEEVPKSLPRGEDFLNEKTSKNCKQI